MPERENPSIASGAVTSTMRQLLEQVRQRHGGKVLDVQRLRLRSGEVVYVFTLLRENRIRRVRMPVPGRSGRQVARRIYNFNSR